MKLGIRVSWPAWLWINSTAEILLHLSAKLWYDVITDLEYESKIKWWTNYFDIFISTSWKAIYKSVNILIAFNNQAISKNISYLKENSIIIASEKTINNLEASIDLSDKKILSLEINDKYENTYLLWVLSKLLDIPLEYVYKELKNVFWKKWEEIVNKNLNIIKSIVKTYNLKIENFFKLEKIWDKKKILYWNKSIAYWAIKWELEFYSAYPMTPASTILSEIINSKKVKYLQAEDEIAVINAALGASFTWARSMVASSWWWFALMTEALSFAIQAEIPIVAVLSQRAGPSTWTPTYFEQWDLNFALNPTFGDFKHILLCPSSIEEAFYFSWLALNLADKYQTVVLILIDKQLSENFASFNNSLVVPEVDRWKMIDFPPSDYKRYELTFDHISPRVKVGTKNGDFIASSYEHDEYWATTEDSEIKKQMTEKRYKKLNNFYNKDFLWYEVINPEAKKMIITMSFTSYTAKEFIKNNSDFGLIIIKVLKPLDNRLFEEIKDKQDIIFVESNYSGQLENYITKEFALNKIETLRILNLRKYDLYPFYYEDFEKILNII